jgi:arginine-tRNA-protein transferase
MGALGEFLYNPVVTSLEFCYREKDGRLVAVGICDVLGDALSSVYCFYDTLEGRRGLGTYTALYELAYAKRQRLRYYYLGYFVSGCQAMRYKASFRPCELLDQAGTWRERSGGDDLPL